jgi:anti-sigma factor RsiW
MSCSEVKGLIQLYMDNELDSRSTLGVQQHLESCSACSRLLDSYLEQDSKLRDYVRSLPIDSRLVRDKILAAIKREPAERRTAWFPVSVWKRVAVFAILATSAAAIALQGGWLPGFNGNVYAAVVADHADHCSFDNLMGAITDVDELNKLAAYAKMSKAPDLSALGYANPRGRTCKVDGMDFLHLIYYSADQQPVSLFMRPQAQNNTLGELTVFRENGYGIASVSKSGVDFIVVSSLSEKETADIAQSVAAQA